MFGKGKTPTVPQLDSYGPYKTAWDKLQELNGELDTVDKQILDRQSLLSSVNKPSEIELAAKQLLEGRISSDEVDVAGMRSELEKLWSRKRVLTLAIEMQRRIVQNMRNEASLEILKGLKPIYAGIVAKMAAAGAELKAACMEEAALRGAINDADLALMPDFHPSPLKGFRSLQGGEEDSYDRWLKEVRNNFPELKV
jgi:hypothetical protein